MWESGSMIFWTCSASYSLTHSLSLSLFAMLVCVCVCVCVCICVYMCVRVYVCVCVSVHVCLTGRGTDAGQWLPSPWWYQRVIDWWSIHSQVADVTLCTANSTTRYHYNRTWYIRCWSHSSCYYRLWNRCGWVCSSPSLIQHFISQHNNIQQPKCPFHAHCSSKSYFLIQENFP